MAVREFDFSNLLIRPTGISGLVGGGISPGSRFLTLNRDLLISLSLEGPKMKNVFSTMLIGRTSASLML